MRKNSISGGCAGSMSVTCDLRESYHCVHVYNPPQNINLFQSHNIVDFADIGREVLLNRDVCDGKSAEQSESEIQSTRLSPSSFSEERVKHNHENDLKQAKRPFK